ncbi:ribonuclease H-like domain-containing protein [Tanacetum coccineum]|uniref:Ribonuclease H-like domain-containing protein n=1 Tax=Tanacetum coccineum TaxID=301880 RepID=A0ABQ4Z3F9_9ASTR
MSASGKKKEASCDSSKKGEVLVVITMLSTILITEPVPTVKEAFSFLTRDESHRTMHCGFQWSKVVPLLLIPEITEEDVDAGAGTSHTLTSDQYHRLMSLLSDSGSSPGVQANVGGILVKSCFVFSFVSTRLGHPADHVSEVLKDMIDLKGIHTFDPCEVCQRAKQTRDLFLLIDVFLRLPSVVLSGKCPYELVYKCQPILSHLSEPSDDEKDKSDGGGTNSSSADPAVKSASADTTSTIDPYASITSKGADSSGYSIPELDSTNMLGSINAEGGADDDGASLFDDDNISDGEDYVVDGNVKYEIIEVVNYSNLSCDNFSSITNLNKTSEPKSFKESVLDCKWVDATNSEIEALNRNNTWIITDLPSGRKPIGIKWIVKSKYKSTGKIERYKVRLVAKGFSQKEGIDYEETFSPVVKLVTISLPEECKGQSSVVLLVYVDDILVTGNDITEVDKSKDLISSKFLIKDFGNLKYLLGIEVIKNEQGVCLSQRKYSLELLSEFGMLACKPSKIPLYVSKNKTKPVKLVDGDEKFLDNITGYQMLVGKLIYLTITRPDIFYVVHKLSQVMHAPKLADMKSDFKVTAFVDSDWAKCTATRKSVTGYEVYLGNCLVS